MTGTPGVGKSRLAREISRNEGYTLVDIGGLVKTDGLYTSFDRRRGSYVLDEAKLRKRLETISKSSNKIVITYHTVGNFIPKNLVRYALVLRLDPSILYKRLRARGWTRKKAIENTEAEAVDVSLRQALELLGSGRVREIDTTKKSLLQVYKDARRAMSKPRTGRVGQVNWLAHFDPAELGRRL